MTKIAAWVIKNKWTKQIARFRYKDKPEAEKCLANLKVEKPQESYHLQLVKESLDDLATEVTNITCSERVVRGVSEDAKTGERRFWRKVFVDVYIYSRFEGWTNLRVYKKHYLRGTLRVICPDTDRSLDMAEFEEYAKKTWPTKWQEVCLFFED